MYLSDNALRAQASYDAMLARGPQEEPTFTVTVEYTIDVSPRQGFTLDKLRGVIGGEAHYAGEGNNGYMAASGTTDLDEIGDEAEGLLVIRNLLSQVPGVNLDDADITVTGPDEDGYDG